MSGEKGISSIHANGFLGASTDGFHLRRKAESLSVLRDLVKGLMVVVAPHITTHPRQSPHPYL